MSTTNTLKEVSPSLVLKFGILAAFVLGEITILLIGLSGVGVVVYLGVVLSTIILAIEIAFELEVRQESN
jgi:hypothetical protein